jgi:hypothetical protein
VLVVVRVDQLHAHSDAAASPSGRAVEIYENKFTGNLGNSWGGIRGGLVVAHHNTISGYGASPNYGLSGYRSTNSFGAFGGADGVNQWDVNDPTVYFEGTVQTSTAGSRTVTINGSPNWTPNDKWKTFTIRRNTNLGGLSGPAHGWIIGSTGNTGPGMSPPGLQFTAGDTVQIRKVLYLMDAPGRARGSLITGLSTPALPADWNDQVTEGCYQWKNGAGHFGFTPGTRSGVNGFDNTPMPDYRPYTYPHSLVSGQPQPTATPTATVAPSPTPPEPTPEPTRPEETPTPPPEQTPTPTPEESQPSLAHAHASLARSDPSRCCATNGARATKGVRSTPAQHCAVAVQMPGKPAVQL